MIESVVPVEGWCFVHLHKGQYVVYPAPFIGRVDGEWRFLAVYPNGSIQAPPLSAVLGVKRTDDDMKRWCQRMGHPWPHPDSTKHEEPKAPANHGDLN